MLIVIMEPNLSHSNYDLNLTNYNAVIARQGPDAQDTKVYWDKN